MKQVIINSLTFKVFTCIMLFISISTAMIAIIPAIIEPEILMCENVPTTPDEKIVEHNSDAENKNNQIESIDSTKYTIFGDLLNDDPVYYKKYHVWRPLALVVGQQAILKYVNRYFFNSDFAYIRLDTWKHNIEKGFVWDRDRFAMNFLLHPYSGGLYFMSGRTNGYSFWKSIPFAVGGSLLWEYFGENSRPSYNDIINTLSAECFTAKFSIA